MRKGPHQSPQRKGEHIISTSAKQQIRIGIVEDNAELRQNIVAMLDSEPGFRCVIAADSVEGFLSRLRQDTMPEVILMDIGLPGMSGIEGMKLIKQRKPEIDIVMLTVFDDNNRIFEALCAGASGYLLKSTAYPQLKTYIEMLHNGGAPMSPQIALKVIQHFQPKIKAPRQSCLSEREKEVVIALVDGLSYKMIADRMNISMGTIYSHIKNIYAKLHVHSRAEVIAKSFKGEI